MSAAEPKTAPYVPATLAPAEGEAAACSLLLVRKGDAWQLVSGSLLTVPAWVGRTSWKRWADLQPPTRRPRREPDGLDLGPIFDVEPFSGIRAVRKAIDAATWHSAVDGLGGGKLVLPQAVCDVSIARWSPTVTLPQGHIGDAHAVVEGAQRPVRGVVAEIETIDIPASEAMWSLATPTYLKPGPALGRMFKHRNLLHWPRELLGIDWLGGPEHPPPPRLVIGRMDSDAWIVDVWPDYEAGEFSISVGWDETRIDPLGCSLLLRVADDELLLMSQHIRISDLPARAMPSDEPRTLRWNERTLTIGLPRGPRRGDWHLELHASDGRLLDERPLVPRIEQITIEIGMAGSSSPASRSVVGDPEPPPSVAESDDAVALATELTTAAREAAAKRRLSTAGDLAKYLRWRFSCRAGELVILDPFLLSGDDAAAQLVFLQELDRPVLGLTGSVSANAEPLLAASAHIDVRRLPHGRPSLHDRIWIVGETGLLIGGSVSTFLPSASGKPPKATTATELPFADASTWRGIFEDWWKSAKP